MDASHWVSGIVGHGALHVTPPSDDSEARRRGPWERMESSTELMNELLAAQQGRSGKIESAKSGKRFSPEPVIETGVGSAGNRTRDLLHPKQESYH